MRPSIALIALGLVMNLDLAAQSARETGPGVITGVVVNAQREPVADTSVQAFPVPASVPKEHAPFTTSAAAQATTDSHGRFRIIGLPLGEYLVGVRTSPWPPSDASKPVLIDVETFHPSAIDHQAAVSVSAVADDAVPIRIAIVRVRGARISGSAVSSSGRPAAGMPVTLFHRFGGEGSGARAGVVKDNGTFETPLLPPGWYQLTIGTRSDWEEAGGELATALLEVQDRDVDGVSLTLKPGASISGRIAAEAGAASPPSVGVRVSASPVSERYTMSPPISARVAPDGTFHMSGLSGFYQFTVSADKEPYVQATRVVTGGRESLPTDGVEFVDGDHEVVVVVAPRATRKSTVDSTLPTEALVAKFKGEKVFWQQLEIAQQIVERHDASIIPSLIGWLTHQDRHIRGNAALIVGGLADPRGFQVIAEMLDDRSDRPEGQGIPGFAGAGRYHVAAQIRSDRYYAVHLLGELRDPQAVPILVSLLKDPQVNYKVAWALAQIGDRRAIGPLIDTLDEDSASVRVAVIDALEALNAKEALPRLMALLDDHRPTNTGAGVSVADAARTAIAKLR